MDTTILPLAEKAGIRAGETVNVLMFNEHGGERLEVLTEVLVRREHGADWLILRWAPGKTTPWGTSSCGFGGWKVDNELREQLRALAA